MMAQFEKVEAIRLEKVNLVDPASCHMFVSKIKPCK